MLKVAEQLQHVSNNKRQNKRVMLGLSALRVGAGSRKPNWMWLYLPAWSCKLFHTECTSFLSPWWPCLEVTPYLVKTNLDREESKGARGLIIVLHGHRIYIYIQTDIQKITLPHIMFTKGPKLTWKEYLYGRLQPPLVGLGHDRYGFTIPQLPNKSGIPEESSFWTVG